MDQLSQVASPNLTPPVNKKVLIVEDDFFIRDLYELEARRVGYEVTSVADGDEAIQKAKEIIPDLLLIDLMLPKKDGISVIREIKTNESLKDKPCIIVTNLADPNKEQEAREAGAVAYLLKVKNQPSQVIETFRRYL